MKSLRKTVSQEILKNIENNSLTQKEIRKIILTTRLTASVSLRILKMLDVSLDEQTAFYLIGYIVNHNDKVVKDKKTFIQRSNTNLVKHYVAGFGDVVFIESNGSSEIKNIKELTELNNYAFKNPLIQKQINKRLKNNIK